MADVFIFDALRTPRGRGKAGKGGLSNHHPQELLAQTLNHMAERKKLDKNLVEDVAIGCVTQVKEQGACIARNALIAARVARGRHRLHDQPVLRLGPRGGQLRSPAKIGAGFIDGGIGGGVESMSRVPMGSDGAMLDGLNEKLRKRLFMVPQGISADLIATREGFTRDDVDKFALASAAEGGARDRGQALRELAVRGQERRRLGRARRATSTRAPTPRSRRSAGSQPAFAQMGATPMGPNGETLDELALKRYPDTKRIEHVHTARQLVGHRRRRGGRAAGLGRVGQEGRASSRARGSARWRPRAPSR